MNAERGEEAGQSTTRPVAEPVTTSGRGAASAGVDGEPTVAAVPGEGGRGAKPTKITSTGENGKRPTKPTTDERSAKPSKVTIEKKDLYRRGLLGRLGLDRTSGILLPVESSQYDSQV